MGPMLPPCSCGATTLASSRWRPSAWRCCCAWGPGWRCRCSAAGASAASGERRADWLLAPNYVQAHLPGPAARPTAASVQVGVHGRISPPFWRQPAERFATYLPAPLCPHRPRRQRLFTIHAAAMLSLQTAFSSCYVAALALQVSQPDCSYAWVGLSALEFVRVRSSGWLLWPPPACLPACRFSVHPCV